MNTIDKFYVYGLIDPMTKELRYVGYTNDLQVRLDGHCKDSKLKNNNHKNNWIKKLKADNFYPEIITLETYNSKQEALLAEIDLIAYYRYIGCPLTNVTDGGDEGAIYERTDDIKNKISKSQSGRKRSEETKLKISKSLMGIKRGERSEEHKKKISLALLGRKRKPVTEETKQKLHFNRFGKKATEEHKINQVTNNKSYKLTQELIGQIKKLHSTGEFTNKELGLKFNVSQSQISRIINNKSGRYLK